MKWPLTRPKKSPSDASLHRDTIVRESEEAGCDVASTRVVDAGTAVENSLRCGKSSKYISPVSQLAAVGAVVSSVRSM